MSSRVLRTKTLSLPILAAATLVVFAIAAALSALMWNADRLSPDEAKIVAIVFFLYAAPFLVLIHELGHMGAALVQGWRVPILAIGGVSLRFSPLRISAGAPAFGPNAAGAVLAVPNETGGGRAGWIAVDAGGPAANVILACLAAYAGRAAPAGSAAYGMFLGVAVISLVSGLYNLVPFRGSDGQHILADFAGYNFAARGRFLRLLAQMIDGKRPRDWDPALARAIEADSIWSGDANGPLAVYAWHLDRGEIDSARAVLRRAANSRNAAVRIEEAFLLAAMDGQPQAARQALSQAGSWHMRRLPTFWRAETATALAEQDIPAAREALRKWAIACRDWAYTTEEQWEWLARMEERVDARGGGA